MKSHARSTRKLAKRSGTLFRPKHTPVLSHALAIRTDRVASETERRSLSLTVHHANQRIPQQDRIGAMPIFVKSNWGNTLSPWFTFTPPCTSVRKTRLNRCGGAAENDCYKRHELRRETSTVSAERTVPSCSVSRTRLSAERTVAAVRLASADSNGDRGCRGAPSSGGNARSPRTLVPSVASPTCLALIRGYAVLRRLLARREFPSGSP